MQLPDGVSSPPLIGRQSPSHSLCSDSRMIAAIVLAAGKSERMGSPKALLTLGGATFLERILHAIEQSSIEKTVVVVGRHRAEIQAAFPDLPLIFNPIWEQGMTTSLQAGIRALPHDVDAAMLFLVDHPFIDPATINTLISHLVA